MRSPRNRLPSRLSSIDEGFWTRPQVGGYIPPARYLFALACNQSEYQSELILMGGKSTDAQPDKWIYVVSEMSKQLPSLYIIRFPLMRLGIDTG